MTLYLFIATCMISFISAFPFGIVALTTAKVMIEENKQQLGQEEILLKHQVKDQIHEKGYKINL